jgi:hypothetical protein
VFKVNLSNGLSIKAHERSREYNASALLRNAIRQHGRASRVSERHACSVSIDVQRTETQEQSCSGYESLLIGKKASRTNPRVDLPYKERPIDLSSLAGKCDRSKVSSFAETTNTRDIFCRRPKGVPGEKWKLGFHRISSITETAFYGK